MGLRDVLFGRKKLSEPSEDRLFALTTAAVTLDTELGLKTAGAAAIAFKPQSSGEFRSAFDEIDKLTDAVAQSCGSQIERQSDKYGYDWIVVHDPDLEDLVGAAHTLASELTRRILGPLRLQATRLAADANMGAPAAHGYYKGRDVTPVSFSWAWGAMGVFVLDMIAGVAESAETTRWREEPKSAKATSGRRTV